MFRKVGLCLIMVALVVVAAHWSNAVVRKGDERAPQIAGPRASLPVIAVVLSYDNGYAWQAQILEGIRSATRTGAELRTYELDTLGVADEGELEAIGSRAVEWVRTTRPDAVIVADDRAMQLVGQPVASDGDVPVVFCGVNWPAASYALPESGMAGMVEVSPVDHAFGLLDESLEPGDSVVMLGANRVTDQVQARGFESLARDLGLRPRAVLVDSFDDWSRAFVDAQDEAAIVVLLNNAGIADWSMQRAERIVEEHTRTLTVTEYEWMKPLTVLAVTKQGQEQGRWAGLQAMHSIAHPGFPAVPVIINRNVSVSVNPAVLAASGRTLPPIFDVLASVSP